MRASESHFAQGSLDDWVQFPAFESSIVTDRKGQFRIDQVLILIGGDIRGAGMDRATG